MKRVILRIAGLVIGAAALASCSTTSPETVPDSSSPSATGSGTSLTIVVSDGSGPTTEVSLTCDPAGGTHPDPAASCDFLAAGAEIGADPFAPVPADRACAEIYGGPATATVTGVWQGKPVDAEFSRTDACQTARWDQAKVLLTVS